MSIEECLNGSTRLGATNVGSGICLPDILGTRHTPEPLNDVTVVGGERGTIFYTNILTTNNFYVCFEA